MIEYFSYKGMTVGNRWIADRRGTAKEINKYAENNGLKIVQISACEDTGLFVVFEKQN